MTKAVEKLDALAELLSKTGGDARRIDAVRRTQRFRRCWVELAEALANIRNEKNFQSWGFKDFYEYCSQELTLKRPTVDKLMISFSTIQKHAPQVLESDGVARKIPHFDAVDYFSRALSKQSESSIRNELSTDKSRKSARKSETPAELQDLSRAVFEENIPVRELKKQFDPFFFPPPPPPGPEVLVRRALVNARKLMEQVLEIDALPKSTRRDVKLVLSDLQERLEVLVQKASEEVSDEHAGSNDKAPRKIQKARSKAEQTLA